LGIGTYTRSGPSIVWNILNNGPFSYTLTNLTIPWSQNSIKLTTVQFGSATLWSSNSGDTDNQGGSSFGPPTSTAEYIWNPFAPNFTFPAGPGSKSLTMTWNGTVNAINDNTLAIFKNDTTGENCSVQRSFP
jgi:hypothetical protein